MLTVPKILEGCADEIEKVNEDLLRGFTKNGGFTEISEAIVRLEKVMEKLKP